MGKTDIMGKALNKPMNGMNGYEQKWFTNGYGRTVNICTVPTNNNTACQPLTTPTGGKCV